MGRILFLSLVIGASTLSFGQTFPVTVGIDPSADTARISPLIYGSNGQSNDWGLGTTARRLGGNRLTGYNWENNASNMGMDYNQSNANDNYMTWSMGIPSNKENIPGITITAFHDTSVAMSCYSLITLQAAGYVSRDKDGTVTADQVAPSARFRNVVMQKGAPFTTQPDTSDDNVYVDEEVNFLVQKYGSASTTTGIKGYDVDNEPALWPSTHPRIHPAKTTCAEIIAKTIACARAVKSVDPAAEVFGGVFYGFNEYYSMQDAPDYSSYRSQGWFVNGFLRALRDSATAAGKRLVDVLDLHWYPDLDKSIINENTDSATVYTRMQVPRSLWDSSYVEPGWIGKWFSPVAIVRKVQGSIANSYPGTKLSFSEFNYGGSSHVSGGIALVDVLGIFGKYGVYFASQWGAIEGYQRAAYALYRNYDGLGGKFGDRHIRATNSNVAKASAYAATSSTDPHLLDVVLINKDFTNTMQASITISGSQSYVSARSFGFDASHGTVTEYSPIPTITGNAFTVQIPPLSVRHLILSTISSSVAEHAAQPATYALEQNFPNPFNPATTIRYYVGGFASTSGGEPDAGHVRLAVYDLLGREVALLVDGKEARGYHEVTWNAKGVASGVYVCGLSAGGFTSSRKMMLVQ